MGKLLFLLTFLFFEIKNFNFIDIKI